MRSSSIEATIARALDAAGLTRHSTGGTAGVRQLIERALDAAHLPRGTGTGTGSGAAPGRARAPVGPGEFTAARLQHAAGTLDYKLYVPAAAAPASGRPLLLMLHGCTQNPDDFAAGTRMNALAEAHGALVAWPAQPARANRQHCWNWFDAAQQQRGQGEPAALAALVQSVAAAHAVDRRRIAVAGLSAGAAMAVILGHAYPDLFGCVAAHSGLACGSAHDVASAFAAMAGQRAAPHGGRSTDGGSARRAGSHPPPRTLVIHGDADATVHPRNGDAILAHALADHAAAGLPLQAEASTGATRRWRDAAGRVRVQHVRVPGGAHAWFGGDSAGSYTDPAGPDASTEVLRFAFGAGD